MIAMFCKRSIVPCATVSTTTSPVDMGNHQLHRLIFRESSLAIAEKHLVNSDGIILDCHSLVLFHSLVTVPLSTMGTRCLRASSSEYPCRFCRIDPRLLDVWC